MAQINRNVQFCFRIRKYTLKPTTFQNINTFTLFTILRHNLTADGNWTGWTIWTMYTVSRGSGTQQRDRECVSQAERGELCLGSDQQTTQCSDAEVSTS